MIADLQLESGRCLDADNMVHILQIHICRSATTHELLVLLVQFIAKVEAGLVLISEQYRKKDLVPHASKSVSAQGRGYRFVLYARRLRDEGADSGLKWGIL